MLGLKAERENKICSDPSSLENIFTVITERKWSGLLGPLQSEGNFTGLWDHGRENQNRFSQ